LDFAVVRYWSLEVSIPSDWIWTVAITPIAHLPGWLWKMLYRTLPHRKSHKLDRETMMKNCISGEPDEPLDFGRPRAPFVGRSQGIRGVVSVDIHADRQETSPATMAEVPHCSWKDPQRKKRDFEGIWLSKSGGFIKGSWEAIFRVTEDFYLSDFTSQNNTSHNNTSDEGLWSGDNISHNNTSHNNTSHINTSHNNTSHNNTSHNSTSDEGGEVVAIHHVTIHHITIHHITTIHSSHEGWWWREVMGDGEGWWRREVVT